ncbi:MAG: phenylalanine--tRNA ligase subunit beta [Proteobacteria bacterium]|nr:phenylalanine--tRNA ligase subunit beta [Pseudomonadota bacterium]MBU1058019.1 phenylalanine--tRNA ligase subunit beta [Pseudomonadota bacterium]
MKFTLNWLKEYVDTGDLSPEALAEHLTMLGLEVDGVTEIFPQLKPLKTAKVLSVESHPNADSLHLCEVAVGEETYSIVCGAPNVRNGLVTAIALPGTIMPDGTKIKPSKVRGIKSNGMLCSERELGLSDSQSGIMELPDDLEHGLPLLQALGLDDLLIEVDLTPNRPDCASVIGIAREIAGITRTPLTLPVNNASLEGAPCEFKVDVEDFEQCPRYTARLIKGVVIAPSPWWIRSRLLAIGLRPINNVVDITNLVMMEYGQPLHAFDYDTLAGKQIFVRCPKPNEKTFTTLDGVERTLEPDMLLICDAVQPVAVGGVMGGLNSEVTAKTTNILLESACFNPISIRRTARRLNLPSEASYRFERGVDPDGCLTAMERAVSLFSEIAGGNVVPGGVDLYGGKQPLNSQTLRISRTSALLGIELDYHKIADVLQSIGIRCKEKDKDTLWVNPPSFRIDIEREVDLVEEVARLIGYNNIPTSLPVVSLSYPEQDPQRGLRSQTATLLTGMGFSEAINYSFVTDKHLSLLKLAEDDPRRQQVTLLNPLSEEQSVMRTMLLPALLENLKRNINFQKNNVKLFEMGKVFTPQGANEQPIERERLAGILSGRRGGESSSFHFNDENVDFLDGKGVMEQILENLRLQGCGAMDVVQFRLPVPAEVDPYCDPLQCLVLDTEKGVLGHLARLQPEVARSFGIKQEVFFFDLDFVLLCSLQAVPKSFSSLPVFPAVKRDIALLVPEDVKAGDLLESVRTSPEKFIECCEIFDVYQGKPLEKGFKSVAISVTYRSPTNTLTEKNVSKSHTKIIQRLISQFNGSLREG